MATTAFTLESSFLCVQEATAGGKELCSPWARQVPTCSTGPPSPTPVSIFRESKCPGLGMFPECVGEWGKETEHCVLQWIGEMRESGYVPGGLGAFSPCPALNYSVGRKGWGN